MNSTIRANVSLMFANVEPCYVSGSQAELGDSAHRITWDNAIKIAENASAWLFTPLPDAVGYMRAWARDTGAWTRSEIEAWSDTEALALFCQNVASEVRTMGADDADLLDCVLDCVPDYEPEVAGFYYRQEDNMWVDWYAGV